MLLFPLAFVLSGAVHAVTLHVNPAHPRSRDSGDGGASQPYRTLAYAVKQLKSGGRLLIEDGVYRESIDLRQAQLKIAQDASPTVIEAKPGGKVLIKGSDIVTGWDALGGGLFVKRNWTVNSQQVFVDGVSLAQIGGTILGGYPERADHPMKKLDAVLKGGIWPGRTPGGITRMTDNNFHYDAGAKNLYIKPAGGSLQGKTVEVSVRVYLLFGEGIDNIQVRNLSFAHSNSISITRAAAITLVGHHITLDHIQVTWTDGNGMNTIGNDNVVKHSIANHCGQTGMLARGRNARLIDNETSYNNTRGFNKWWEAGGAKFVGEGGLQDSEVSGHRAFFNRGDGIWFDWKNRNNRIHDNISAYNQGMGLHYEASEGAHIVDNYVFGNRQRGIYLPNSSGSTIAHNLVANNGLDGIVIVNERKEQAQKDPDLLPNDNRVAGNILAWNGKNALVLPQGLLGNTAHGNLFVSADTPPGFSLGWASIANPTVHGLSAWSALSGQDAHSLQRTLPVPTELASALKNGQTKLDWSMLTTLASERKGAADAPGPRR